MTFALGITFGIGTAWILFQTGVMTGVLAVLFARAGQLESFAAEILPHGVVEIPACLISAAAGFLLAEALFRARPWPRVEELARRGKQALFLLAGCVPLLAAAAFLEMVIARAPQWLLGNNLKLGVGGVVFLSFAAYIFLFGWGRLRVAREATG